MSAHILLNLLNELWKRDTMRGLLDARLAGHFIFFTKSLINSIIQEQNILDSIYHMTLRSL